MNAAETSLRWSAVASTLPDLPESERRELASKLHQEGCRVSGLPLEVFARGCRATPLSSGQMGLWIEEQLAPGHPAWVIPGAVRIRGEMDVARLQAAFRTVIDRHGSLRTTFFESDGIPSQSVQANLFVKIEIERVDGWSLTERVENARAKLSAIPYGLFDLQSGPPCKVVLVPIGPDDHVCAFYVHHIAADAWSISILTREVTMAYSALLRAGSVAARPPSRIEIEYVDFAAWETALLASVEFEEPLEAAISDLADITPSRLGSRSDHPGTRAFEGARVQQRLSAEGVAATSRLCSEHRTTLATVFMTALQQVLFERTGQERFLVGLAASNRNRNALEHVVGYFVNLVPIQADLRGTPTFGELLERVKVALLRGMSRLHVPFGKIAMARRRILGHRAETGLNVMLVVQNHPRAALSLTGADLEVSVFQLAPRTTRFDLTLFVDVAGAGVEVSLEYATKLYSQADARSFLQDLVDQLIAPGALEPHMQEHESACGDASGALIPLKPNNNGESNPGDVALIHKSDDTDPMEWVGAQRERLLRWTASNGAVLVRGLNISSVGEFEQLIGVLSKELLADTGELPRLALGKRVFSSVDYPPQERVLWHNENAFHRQWPGKLWLACLQAPDQGGATTLADGRRMMTLLPAGLRDEFRRRKLLYIRNYRHGLGLDWQSAFGTEGRHVVEQRCKQLGLICRWMGEELRTYSIRPAVVCHPATREVVWFNQVTHWHPFSLPNKVRAALEAHYSLDELPRYVRFGDGGLISDSIMEEIHHAYERAEVFSQWRSGDLLILDNILMSHGRQAYAGARQLAIAMSETTTESEVELGDER